MNPYKMIFDINEKAKIIIEFEEPLPSICYRCEDPVMLLYNNQSIMLAEHPSYLNVIQLRDILEQILNNELYLSSSITSDIGYLYNGYCYNVEFINKIAKSGNDLWDIYKYQLWRGFSSKGVYMTWMYMNEDGDIIFEVTPYYPYFSYNYRKQRKYNPFKKWIVRYKPYFIATISREKAQEWLDQAKEFIKNIDDNNVRWEENKRQGKASEDPYYRKLVWKP